MMDGDTVTSSLIMIAFVLFVDVMEALRREA